MHLHPETITFGVGFCVALLYYMVLKFMGKPVIRYRGFGFEKMADDEQLRIQLFLGKMVLVCLAIATVVAFIRRA